MKQEGQTRAGLGVPSLVLILLVLCLALLGVLSLMSARTDLQMSRRHTQLAELYAQAAAGAQEALADLDAQMAHAWQSCAEETAYAATCQEIVLAAGVPIEWVDETHVRFTLDAGAQRALNVEIERSDWAKAGESRFEIVRHALEDTSEWEQTESLILMGVE